MFEYIKDLKLAFTKPLTKRANTTMIVLHHTAASDKQTVEQIHAYHKTLGLLGIGYNIIVDKNGVAYWGRGLDNIGAHASGYNNTSVGVCAIGNFEVNQMPAAQKAMLIKIVADLKKHYGISKVVGHKEIGSTACPGKYYPLVDIKAAEIETPVVYDDKDTAWVSVKLGSKGEVVKAMQNKLNKLGFNCGTADGWFGNKTLDAVKAFQKSKGLTVDGIINGDEWLKLLDL